MNKQEINVVRDMIFSIYPKTSKSKNIRDREQMIRLADDFTEFMIDAEFKGCDINANHTYDIQDPNEKGKFIIEGKIDIKISNDASYIDHSTGKIVNIVTENKEHYFFMLRHTITSAGVSNYIMTKIGIPNAEVKIKVNPGTSGIGDSGINDKKIDITKG